MADVRGMFTQQFEAARIALGRGDQEAAAECLRAAVLAARSDPNLQRELASALLHLGKVAQKLGRAGEAEQFLTEALAISERLFGMEHPALGPLLNELSRLHLQQSHHARAEIALERLLGIARAKGEENAEVATALAGLALVKRRLGDDASAEARYRDALRIREKVLAPDHMVIVVTLEQLSETCAARGNFAEALALLRRALPTREKALGADHATTSATRSRITALELQVAAPASDPKELVFLYKPEPRVRPVARPAPPVPPARSTAPVRARPTTPTYTAAVAAASLIASPIQTTSLVDSMMAPHENVPASAGVTGRRSGAVHRDVVAHHDAGGGDAVYGGRRSAAAPVHYETSEQSPKKRTGVYALAGGAVVAIAIAGLMFRSSAGGGDATSTTSSAELRTAAVVAPVVAKGGTTKESTRIDAAAAAAARADSLRAVSATVAPPTRVVQGERRAPESVPAPSEPSVPFVPFHPRTVNIGTIATTNVDSIVRLSTKRRDSYTDKLGAGVGLPVSVGSHEVLTSSPTIIGRAPLPHFPDALRSVQPEGEVIVRFKVDERGRVDVSSMAVVKSDHELFTDAVRDILPNYRFEPARTPAPESKPVAVWVNLPFKFTAKN